MKRILAISALVMAASCTNTTDKVLVSEYCVKSNTDLVLMPITHVSCANNVCTSRVQMMLVPRTTCDQHIKIIEGNANYKETQT